MTMLQGELIARMKTTTTATGTGSFMNIFNLTGGRGRRRRPGRSHVLP